MYSVYKREIERAPLFVAVEKDIGKTNRKYQETKMKPIFSVLLSWSARVQLAGRNNSLWKREKWLLSACASTEFLCFLYLWLPERSTSWNENLKLHVATEARHELLNDVSPKAGLKRQSRRRSHPTQRRNSKDCRTSISRRSRLLPSNTVTQQETRFGDGQISRNSAANY